MKRIPKVLLVDDDANLRKTLSDILKFKGYVVAAAVNGAAAIAEAQRVAVDVALIDLMLPDMPGIEVMERIKKISPRTEAIILTGHASLETAIEATSKGAFSYLLKPYEIENLLLHIRLALDRQQSQEEIRRLASFPRLNPQPVIEIAPSGEVTYANPAADKLFSDLCLLAGQHPLFIGLENICASLREGNQTEIVREIAIGASCYEEHLYYVPESELIRITVLDVTDRKLAETHLRLAAIAFESNEGMLITDANNVILRVNYAFTKITGYTPEEVIGKNPRVLKSGLQDANFYASMWKSINDSGTWKGEIQNRLKNGDICPGLLHITAVRDKNDAVTNYVATLSDLTTINEATEKIKQMAFYDHLTGLPNRRLLLDRLHQAFTSSARSGLEGAVMFIDIDKFKDINDTLGHDIGDLLLKQIAERLNACVREGDTVARLGGDEFVVMLEDLSEQAIAAAIQVKAVCDKIFAKLNQPYQLATHEYHGTVSIGATLFSDHAKTAEEVLKRADIAMYQAKLAGRSILKFFDTKMQDVIGARVSLQTELRKALENRQFYLHYQIQVDSSRNILGAEALIRWLHPDRGLVSPAEFIPVAEETGLILPIGLWVLETACAQIKAWEQNALARGLALAVNVSARQFNQPDFADQVKAVAQRHAINPKLLKLELTESMLHEDIEGTIEKMNTLKAFGIQFSLDDFGTGYSSLQYLKRLPLDQLKIDQSFVRNICTDSGDKAVVRAIIAMAHSLNLDVIAEGVETEEQQQILLNTGCTNFQGYLFSKPVPIEQFEKLLHV